jgi:uncharacterized protein involved in exopolysaccharide biosynthesis
MRRQWRAVLSFVALGVLGALGVVLFAPKRYDGQATVLARTTTTAGGSILGRMGEGGIGQLLGSLGGDLADGGVETELQMLQSKTIVGQVVDSLQLQFSVRDPAGMPSRNLVVASALRPVFKPRRYTFRKTANGSYSVSGDDDARTATPGERVELDVGIITLASDLPERFVVKIYDRADAIKRFLKRMDAVKAGGDVAEITIRTEDSLTAASATNALVHFYLERRRTVDRGANQRRLEYVTEQVHQTAMQLAEAEKQLRHYQEQTQVFEPEMFEKVKLDAASALRAQVVQLQVDEIGLNQLLEQADRGQLTSSHIVAHPSFIRGSTVSPFVTQLSDLEIMRTKLLERRTERDPEVVTLDKNIANVSANIVSMARSYASSIRNQRVALQERLDSAEATLRTLPAANERVGRLARDVLRLTQLYTALQAQQVEARLAAIGEGGEIRQVDFALTPRKPAFPEPWLTMGLGTAGGLFAGIIAALFVGWFGRWLRDPVEIERLTGVSAQLFRADAPLLVSGAGAPRTVLVIPLDPRAQAGVVAQRLARTATVRSMPVSLLDFTSNGSGNGTGAGHAVTTMPDVSQQIDALEGQPGMIVVQLPSLWSDATLAALRETRPVVLVAPPGPVDRARLTSALETLRRLNVPCAGIVVDDRQVREREHTHL